ncbi:phage tail spike protein [Bacillus toyonensis]|uniref:phage tail spike protein n=1 Tax=Bacillus toyonensis TaxID=155322 RepID=UPI0025424F80|nr:phage tail spike protein [Bacillus toyonensis]WIG40315.1 phage tail spike protein [Bacillus toyonensis]
MSKANNLLHIVDFKTEQIIGVIKEQDYWDDLRQWDLKDNKDKFEFTTADGTKIAASLIQQNLVVKQTRDGTFVSYIITEVEQDTTGRPKKIYALGEHTKLKKATVIKPQTLQATTVNESTNFALQGTEWKRGITEFVGIRTIHIKDFTNPLDLLKQIASTFELEIRFRTEILGSFIVGRYVDLVKKVGRDNGKEFLLGKDVQGIRRIENSQDVVTALVGVGPQNSETGEFLTFEEINNGKLYVGNNDALQRWSKDGKHLFDIYSPQTEDQDMTKQRLKQLTEAELKKRIDSSTSYEVSAVALEKVFGLSHESVRKGDKVRIKDTGFSPPLFLEARLIAADECDTDPSKDKYIFGNYREIKDTRSLIDRLYAQIMGSLSNKASKELLDMLDKKLQENVKETEVIRKESEAAKKIAEQVAENLKNNTVYIIEGINPPTANLKDRKTLWQDISKGKPGILKLWKDGKWDPVVPDVESVKKETLEQVSKDIESTKSEINQKVQSVEGKAQEIVKQISDVQKQVNDKVDQTWINTQLKDKADKAGVYTKDEIKDGFIGKQIYETDKQGNVKKFQEISTSFEQTNEAIKSKAEKQSVTDLGNNLSQVSKVANEAKQTAEGNTSTITSVQATVNKINDDVTNLLIDSGTFEGAGVINVNFPERWYLKGSGTKISADVFQGSAVFETQSSWSGIGYNFKDLINREVLKVGDKVNFSFYARLKGLPAGETRPHVFFFRGSASGTRWTDLNSDWKRYSVTFTINADMMGTSGNVVESFIRTEIEANTGATVWYQQSQPQLTIGDKLYTWRTAPEDNATIVKKSNEIKQTVDSNISTIQNIQKDQGKLTERITKSEQTADGFKTSIESLTKKDTDISNKLNTVEQTVEGTKKTISDVQQTTNGLSKTTTEIKEEAGKISTKLEQVEARTVGGENWLINTGRNQKPQTIGMSGGALVNKAGQAFSEDYIILECTDHTDSFYQFHLDNTKMGDYEKGKDMTCSIDLQNDVPIDLIVFQFINGVWTENLYNRFLVANWSRRSFTFKIDERATGWGLRLRFERNANSKGKKVRFKKAKLEKGSVPTDFSKSTYELEQSVDGIKETVTKVENNQNGFDKRVTAVEKTAEGISQNVTKIQETQTAQGKQIFEAQSTIKQHSDALDLTVKMKDVENYVGGLGSINEIRDAGFTQGNKYWGWATGHSIDPNLKYKGYNSFSMHTTGQAQDVWWGAFSQFIECSPNEDIVISAYFNTDGKVPIDNGVFIEMEFWQSNKTNRISTARERVQIVNNTWIRAICTAKAPAGTGFVRFRPYVQRNGRAWFCMPMLQRGKVATEFWLHPKDQTDADKMIEDIANRVATKDYDKKTTELERLISANTEGIKLAAVKNEVYTKQQADGRYADKAYVEKQEGRIEVTEKAITSTVQKGDIISAINQTAEKISISVSKLDINADTVVKWLTAKGIDADVIKISGDKVTIDKNGITAKMADFFFEDERGQKFSVTPRKNLIPDHDFSHISFKNFNNYFLKIEYSPTWTIMSNPYIEKPVVNNYEPMVNPLRIDLSNWIRFTLFDGVKPGKKYTLSAHFRATTNDNRVNITNKPIMRAVFGKYNGDTPVELGRASKTYDAPSIQTGKIVRYALTFTVPSNYVEGNGYVYIDLFGEGLLNNMQAIAVSGVQLVEGDVPSVYNWDTTHGELVNGTLPFSTIALGTKDNVIYHNHVNKWNYMNAPLEIISNGEMMALVGDDRAGLSFYPRGGGERRSYIGHIYNNENRFRIESKDPVATTQSIECNGINVCGGYFGANAGSIHYTNGSLGLGWYFHDGRWNYVDFTNMTSRT